MGLESEAALHDQEIHTIRLSDADRNGGVPSLEFIAEAVAFLHRDGIIRLENAVHPAHLDHLNAVMQPDALKMAELPDQHFNFGSATRNMDQAPPPVASLMYKDVWANAFVSAALSSVLGPQPTVHYAMGNTALQASPSGRQPVHSDVDFAHPVFFPWAYVVNIPLIDTTPKNGATEFWPGSHHVSTPEAHASPPSSDGGGNEHLLQIQPVHVEARRTHSPPIQPSVAKGSIIIRDLRLWHAGRPNLTPSPRIMLAFVVTPAWFQCPGRVPLPSAVKPLVDSWSDEICFHAQWVDDEVDHTKLNSQNAEFGTGSMVLKQYEKQFTKWPAYVPRWY